MNALKLQKKRQAKEAKRILKHKAVRKSLNLWKGLGKDRQKLALNRAQRTNGINLAILHLESLIKKWNDKISVKLLNIIEIEKKMLLEVLKTKDISLIDAQIKSFAPLNQEVIDIVKKLETVASVDCSSII